MRAVTVAPGVAGSLRVEVVPEPGAGSGSVLVEALAVGICGTDIEIADGRYGWAPPGRERLVLGHESLGRVLDPGASGFEVGEHVVGIVRRPDPVPCPNCAVGEWDMCSNGEYTERGIKEIESCWSVAGDESYILKTRVATPGDLEDLLARIRSAANVSTRTTIVLSTPYENRPVG